MKKIDEHLSSAERIAKALDGGYSDIGISEERAHLLVQEGIYELFNKAASGAVQIREET